MIRSTEKESETMSVRPLNLVSICAVRVIFGLASLSHSRASYCVAFSAGPEFFFYTDLSLLARVDRAIIVKFCRNRGESAVGRTDRILSRDVWMLSELHLSSAPSRIYDRSKQTRQRRNGARD